MKQKRFLLNEEKILSILIVLYFSQYFRIERLCYFLLKDKLHISSYQKYLKM